MINESFIVAIAFIVFIALTYKPSIKLILSMLDKYTAEATRDVEEAGKIHEQATEMLEAIKHEYQEAKASSTAIIAMAKQEADMLLAEAAKEVNRITAKKAELAMARIMHQEKQMVQHLKDTIVQQAVRQAHERMAQDLTAQVQTALIEKGRHKASMKFKDYTDSHY